MDVFGTLKGQPCVLTIGMRHQPGDQPPSGYNDWHEWASVQHKAGLRQARCCLCSKWKYPQELSHIRRPWEAVDSKGRTHRGVSPVCNECSERAARLKRRQRNHA